MGGSNGQYYITVWIVFILQNLHLSVSQDCTFPQELWGNWTSTNLGTIVISGTTPSLTFDVTFIGQTVPANDMDCKYINGTQYILKSKEQIETFSTTNPIFMWMCLDLRRASAYSYNYYLNSPSESGFDNYRLVGRPDTSTVASDVCTEIPDTAEFHTMIKVGQELDAVNAVQCPDVVLGSYTYTYTDSSQTYCENSSTSFTNSCNNANKTHILVNNSDCAAVKPFYANDGQLGCIGTVHNSTRDVYYISLYNLDTSPNPTFVCVAANMDSNGTVYLSTRQTNCESGQTPTDTPTAAGEASMVLKPSCLDTVSSRRNWTWLYILLPCLGLLIIFIIVLFLLYYWLKKRELKRARKKQALPNADHPLGEVSLQLDAPAALGMQHGYIDRKRDLLDKPPRRRMSEDREDLFGEQSLDLNLEIETWTIPKRGRPPPITENGFSGAIVNGSVSNGSYSQKQPNGIAPGQKARASGPKSKVSSTGSGRLVSKTKNFLTARMAANNLKSRPHNPFTKSYERSTKASSGRTILRNGVHPEPHFGSSLSLAGSRVPSRAESKAVSRPGSRALSITGSRRGSIDDLVSSRSSKMPRSKTMVLDKTKEEKRPDIYTMPEEYATEGGPNEVMPTRPPPVTGNILRDAYQTFKGKSQTNVSLKKPMATRKPWH